VPGRAGRPRAFLELDAFWVAVAATLYDRAGLRRPALERVLGWLDAAPWPLRPPPRGWAQTLLGDPFPGRAKAWLYAGAPADAAFEVGDLAVFRVVAKGVDKRWVHPDTWMRMDPADRPLTVVRQELAELRKAFGGLRPTLPDETTSEERAHDPTNQAP